MGVRQAQASIDAREFAEWLAYYELEPYGPQRADLRAGIIAAVTANAFRCKGQAAFKPQDFMPRFASEPRRQTAAEQEAVMREYVRGRNHRLDGK